MLRRIIAALQATSCIATNHCSISSNFLHASAEGNEADIIIGIARRSLKPPVLSVPDPDRNHHHWHGPYSSLMLFDRVHKGCYFCSDSVLHIVITFSPRLIADVWPKRTLLAPTKVPSVFAARLGAVVFINNGLYYDFFLSLRAIPEKWDKRRPCT